MSPEQRTTAYCTALLYVTMMTCFWLLLDRLSEIRFELFKQEIRHERATEHDRD